MANQTKNVLPHQGKTWKRLMEMGMLKHLSSEHLILDLFEIFLSLHIWLITCDRFIVMLILINGTEIYLSQEHTLYYKVP